MKSVFIQREPGVSHIPLLYPNLGAQERESILFLNRAFVHLKEPLVTIVDDPSKADVILFPHNYSSLKGKDDSVHEQADLAKQLGKKFIVFWHGDSDAIVPYENALVFRTSLYRSRQRKNEVSMPAYAEDLLQGPLELRTKHDGKPSIGFCGWAGYKNTKNQIGTALQNAYVRLMSVFSKNALARMKGLTWRMKAIDNLQTSNLVRTNFIIRNAYSGHSSTIQTDPSVARAEYVNNLQSSDYALVVKGDGNYSYRFYEALSLGRIPVLLDTDCVLPLEDQIDYNKFIVRVPFREVHAIDRYIAEHYQRTSEQDFITMQKQAREVFEKYLRVDRFLADAVERYF